MNTKRTLKSNEPLDSAADDTMVYTTADNDMAANGRIGLKDVLDQSTVDQLRHVAKNELKTSRTKPHRATDTGAVSLLTLPIRLAVIPVRVAGAVLWFVGTRSLWLGLDVATYALRTAKKLAPERPQTA